MKQYWFFANNELTVKYKEYCDMTLAMLASQSINAPDLIPLMIYDGEPCEFTRLVEESGATILYHKYSLIDTIAENPLWEDVRFQRITRGTYLRLDIPTLFEKHQLNSSLPVLYTDIDVIFLRQPPPFELGNAPFACAPEFDKEDYCNINAGVMYINIEGMSQTRHALCKYIKQHHLDTTAYDQGILRGFYTGQWGHLPIEYNWKPYWGINENALLVHYHGPKAFMRGSQHVENSIKDLQVGGYAYYCGVYDAYLNIFNRVS